MPHESLPVQVDAPMKILVIEDEKRVAQFLKKGFQEEAYAVDVASDGVQGLSLALTGDYDAIVLDIMLPRKNGFEVLQELRREKIATPILILSSKSEVEDRVEGLNLGADDYLPKPFAFSEALARIRSIMRRQQGTEDRASELTLADLKVDLLSRRVTRSGSAITLTNKEFQVLEYLLRNKGRVLSRVILTEHIWDMNFDTETNIVDVVINRLRRKIDDHFSPPLIHTVRGVGYVMREPEPGDDSTA
jgi:two-component system copper resistance phosphate regulon response regulator CusR